MQEIQYEMFIKSSRLKGNILKYSNMLLTQTTNGAFTPKSEFTRRIISGLFALFEPERGRGLSPWKQLSSTIEKIATKTSEHPTPSCLGS